MPTKLLISLFSEPPNKRLGETFNSFDIFSIRLAEANCVPVFYYGKMFLRNS